MTKYDSTLDTLFHTRRVGELILSDMYRLGHRAITHDLSKFQKEEKDLFDKYTPVLKELEYGTEEYIANLQNLAPAIQHHYANNSHHPEYYNIGISGMDLIDIIEMVNDWIAASERTKNGDILKSLEYNIKRFNIEPQLASIITNHINRYVRPDQRNGMEVPN